MILPEPIEGDADFFRAFARFEQVLKARGYYTRPSPAAQARVSADPPVYPDVTPDWDTFAKARPELVDFLEDHDLDPQISYIVDNPPWHEVVIDGQLAYQKKEHEVRDIVGLLRAVRRVRNNLFHGAKTTLGPMNDPARNRQLIASSMAVLRAVLTKCPDMDDQFSAYDW